MTYPGPDDASFGLWANLQPVLLTLVFITLPLFGVIVVLGRLFSRAENRWKQEVPGGEPAKPRRRRRAQRLHRLGLLSPHSPEDREADPVLPERHAPQLHPSTRGAQCSQETP